MWWSILIATIAGWAICVGVQYYPCTFASIEYVQGKSTNVDKRYSSEPFQRNATSPLSWLGYADRTAYKLDQIFLRTF